MTAYRLECEYYSPLQKLAQYITVYKGWKYVNNGVVENNSGGYYLTLYDLTPKEQQKLTKLVADSKYITLKK